MGILIKPGYWICDRITGKRIRWVPPQQVEISKKRIHGIGSGNNHNGIALVLEKSPNIRKRR